MTKTVQIRKRGTLTLPKIIREKYHLDDGDPVTIIDTGEGFYISPKPITVTKIASEIAEIMKKEDVTLEDLLEDLKAERLKNHR